MTSSKNNEQGFATVNGIKLYYEIYGQGEPLVLIHGGGSTIQSCFGSIIPLLAKSFKLVAVELQNHGRSGFRDDPQTFEQDADDVAGLLMSLGIAKANYLGFSNGGTTVLHIALRHPQLVNKLILGSAAYKRNGLMPGFFEAMQQVTLNEMPTKLQAAFLEVNPDQSKLQTMFEKDRDRMIAFKDIADDQIASIRVPTLVINADMDVITTQHALEIHRAIKGSRLAIIPGIHGQYLGEITTLREHNTNIGITVTLIKEFLG